MLSSIVIRMLMPMQATAGLRALGVETSENILQAVIIPRYSSEKGYAYFKLERILSFILSSKIK